MISQNEWKYVAELETSLATNLPEITCLSDGIGQVLLNLIVNGAHAIKEHILKVETIKNLMRILQLSLLPEQ
jgi:nitrogen-specific signal transduction histidine kinase